MIGLIIATSIIGALLVSAITVGAIKIYKLEKNLNNLAECLLTYITSPADIDIIEDYSSTKRSNKKSKSDLGFPNSEGF